MISNKHSDAARSNLRKAEEAKKKKRINKPCEHCAKNMELSPSLATQRFCCWDCRIEFMKGPNAANAGGGKWMKGQNNPNWKGGTTDRRNTREKQEKINQWRRSVFYRDNYACQICGYTKGGNLNAHHRIPWAIAEEVRFDVNNGITLCKPCHKQLHEPVNKPNGIFNPYLLCPPKIIGRDGKQRYMSLEEIEVALGYPTGWTDVS